MEQRREAEEEAQQRQFEAQEREKEREREAEEREKQRQFELRKLELQRAPQVPIPARWEGPPLFLVENDVRLIPKFQDTDIETFLRYCLSRKLPPSVIFLRTSIRLFYRPI